MYDQSFQILYLGEDFAWSKISPLPLNEAARFPLKICRTQSLNELFLILGGGQCHAVAIDVQAWRYQGLHYVDKIRSEYPVFPILALYSASEEELARKAKTSGASRCLPIEQLTPEAVHLAILSCVSERKSPSHAETAQLTQTSADMRSSAPAISSKNQVISHALTNLLCVITANADVLEEHVGPSGPGVRSLAEIKKAARSACDLMRLIR
jgi:DNA-binding NtrC family response regulator